MKRVALTVHGVNTRGVWQKALTPLLSRHSFITYHLDYGNFVPPKILIGSVRNRKIWWVNKEITDIREKENINRPAVIAHSFGTYLLAEALMTYPNLKVGNVILCGSVLDQNFNWSLLFDRGQITGVRNEMGGRDWVVSLARLLTPLVPDIGQAGRVGFSTPSERVLNLPNPMYRHSMFFDPGHGGEDWIRFLNELWMSTEDRIGIHTLLSIGLQQVSNAVGVPVPHLRANIMVADRNTGYLYIPTGLAYPEQLYYTNDQGENELSMRIPLGTGCAGVSLATEKPVAAIASATWSPYIIPQDELRKTHPALRWIMCAPIFLNSPSVDGEPFAVLNIDSLHTERSLDDLKRVKYLLKRIASKIGQALKDTL